MLKVDVRWELHWVGILWKCLTFAQGYLKLCHQMPQFLHKVLWRPKRLWKFSPNAPKIHVPNARGTIRMQRQCQTLDRASKSTKVSNSLDYSAPLLLSSYDMVRTLSAKYGTSSNRVLPISHWHAHWPLDLNFLSRFFIRASQSCSKVLHACWKHGKPGWAMACSRNSAWSQFSKLSPKPKCMAWLSQAQEVLAMESSLSSSEDGKDQAPMNEPSKMSLRWESSTLEFIVSGLFFLLEPIFSSCCWCGYTRNNRWRKASMGKYAPLTAENSRGSLKH